MNGLITDSWFRESMNQCPGDYVKQWINESMRDQCSESMNQWIIEWMKQRRSEAMNQWNMIQRFNGAMNPGINETCRNQCLSESVIQWINECTSEPVRQSIVNEPMMVWMSERIGLESTNQRTHETMNHWFSERVNQWTHESVNPWVQESMKEGIDRWRYGWASYWVVPCKWCAIGKPMIHTSFLLDYWVACGIVFF